MKKLCNFEGDCFSIIRFDEDCLQGNQRMHQCARIEASMKSWLHPFIYFSKHLPKSGKLTEPLAGMNELHA